MDAVARLFVAIALPHPVRAALVALAPAPAPGIRRVSEENLHLTLKFLGDAEVGVVSEALSHVPFEPFHCTLCGGGAFERRGRGGTLWVGIEECAAQEGRFPRRATPRSVLAATRTPRENGSGSPLSVLHRSIERRLAEAGIPADSRPFAPHVTIARYDARAPRAVASEFRERVARFRCEDVAVTRFELRSSELGRGGPRYTVVRAYGDGDGGEPT